MSAKQANKLTQFWADLKRRKVIRVIIAYAAAAFVLLELVDIIAEPLGLPGWTINFVLILLCVGFVITLVLSWVYDITPEGIRKTKSKSQIKSNDEQVTSKGWKIATYISGLVIIGFVVVYLIGNIKQSSDISKLEKSIAVLPFENWSNSEEFSFYGDAIANEIITQLFKIKQFHVPAFTSTSKYKGSDKLSIPEIGKELNVNFVIEGSIERQNEDVSIHVQVIQAEIDNHIWANEFKGQWKDIFTIRADIAVKIAEELKTLLSQEELEQIKKEPTMNTEAYEHFLKGRSIYEESGALKTKEAVVWFKEAIKLDSTFALPWTYLSMCYWRQSNYLRMPELFQEAKMAAKRAIELDPTSGVSIVNMAEILDNEYNWGGAEEYIRLALEIEPDNPYVLRNVGRFYTIMGRHDESIEYCNRALQYDPINQSALFYLAKAYFYAGQYEEARATLTKYNELGYVQLAETYYQLLLEDDKIEQVVKEPSFENNENMHNVVLAAIYLKSGDKLKAEELLTDLLEKDFVFKNYYIAIAHAYGDNPEGVSIWLERSMAAKESILTYLGVDPAFKKYRNEPRVKKILQEMNFPF